MTNYLLNVSPSANSRNMIPRAMVIGFAILLLLSQPAAARDRGDLVVYGDCNAVYSIATSLQRVYVATTGGIIVYNKSTRVWEEPLTGIDGINGEEVIRLWADWYDERLAAETRMGFYELDFALGRWWPVSSLPERESDGHSTPMPTVLFAPPGYTFTGSAFADAYSRSFQITELVEDSQGNLWIGTWGMGLLRANIGGWVAEPLPYGLIQPAAYVIAPDTTKLWLAGPILNAVRSGVTIFDRATNAMSYIETGLLPDWPRNDVNCLLLDSLRLSVGSSRGLRVYDRNSSRLLRQWDRRSGLSDEAVLSLVQTGDTLVVGTASGLVALFSDLDSLFYIQQEFFFNTVIYDLEIIGRQLWIGASTGAYRYNLDTGRLQRFEDPTQVLFGRVFALFRQGAWLWLSSDAGLVHLNLETAQIESFRMASHKLDSRAVAANDSIAAMASDHGFALVRYRQKDAPIREYDVEDGLPSAYVYSLLFDGDYLWVGTDRGLVRWLWNNPRRID